MDHRNAAPLALYWLLAPLCDALQGLGRAAGVLSDTDRRWHRGQSQLVYSPLVGLLLLQPGVLLLLLLLLHLLKPSCRCGVLLHKHPCWSMCEIEFAVYVFFCV